jgi:hypothetical protein
MEMNDIVNVIGLLAMVITWFIVSPLKEAIQALRVSVEKLSDSLERRREELSILGERVARNEKGLEDLGDEFHSFCNNCTCRKE